jgi:hypothetical protein
LNSNTPSSISCDANKWSDKSKIAEEHCCSPTILAHVKQVGINRRKKQITEKENMEDRSYARFERFGRIYAFGQKNLADTLNTDAAVHLENLGKIIAALEEAAAGQNPGNKTPAQVILDATRLDIQNITRTARALAQDDPAYGEMFRPPESLNPRAVVIATDRILGNLIANSNDVAAVKTAKAQRVTKFVSKGLPADFATHLQSERAGFTKAREEEQDGNNDGVKNTAAIGRLISEGTKECSYLDAIFRNIYTRNPDQLRAWLSASHLERLSSRSAKSAAPEGTDTAAAPKVPAQ